MRDLSNAGFIARDERFLALQGGRTNQVWRFGNDGEHKVLKVYRPADKNPLFGNDSRRETLCLKTLRETGLAPRLLNHGNHPLGHWIIYQHVSGQSWNSDPAPVARLLARVHARSPLTGLQSGINGSAELERQTLEILKQCQPNDREHIIAVMPKWQVSPMDSPRL
ncbi:MAG: aminoglycoside phosphotransferase family protein, partial [Paracoccaceae bacterium]